MLYKMIIRKTKSLKILWLLCIIVIILVRYFYVKVRTIKEKINMGVKPKILLPVVMLIIVWWNPATYLEKTQSNLVSLWFQFVNKHILKLFNSPMPRIFSISVAITSISTETRRDILEQEIIQLCHFSFVPCCFTFVHLVKCLICNDIKSFNHSQENGQIWHIYQDVQHVLSSAKCSLCIISWHGYNIRWSQVIKTYFMLQIQYWNYSWFLGCRVQCPKMASVRILETKEQKRIYCIYVLHS